MNDAPSPSGTLRVQSQPQTLRLRKLTARETGVPRLVRPLHVNLRGMRRSFEPGVVKNVWIANGCKPLRGAQLTAKYVREREGTFATCSLNVHRYRPLLTLTSGRSFALTVAANCATKASVAVCGMLNQGAAPRVLTSCSMCSRGTPPREVANDLQDERNVITSA